MGVQNVKTLERLDHSQRDAVAHEFELAPEPENGYTVDLVLARQGFRNVRIGCEYGGMNAELFQPVGNLKRLVGRTADIRQEGFDASKDVQSFSKWESGTS